MVIVHVLKARWGGPHAEGWSHLEFTDAAGKAITAGCMSPALRSYSLFQTAPATRWAVLVRLNAVESEPTPALRRLAWLQVLASTYDQDREDKAFDDYYAARDTGRKPKKK